MMISHPDPANVETVKPAQSAPPPPVLPQQQQQQEEEEAPLRVQPTPTCPDSSSSSLLPSSSSVTTSLSTPMPSLSSSLVQSRSSLLSSPWSWSWSWHSGSTLAAPSTVGITTHAQVDVAVPRGYSNNNNNGSCNGRTSDGSPVESLADEEEQHSSKDVDKNDEDDDNDDDNDPAAASLDRRRHTEEGHHCYDSHNSSKSQTTDKRTTPIMNGLDDEDIEYYLSSYEPQEEADMTTKKTTKTTENMAKSKPTPSCTSPSSSMMKQQRRAGQRRHHQRHSRRQCQGMTRQGTQCTLPSLDPDDWKANNKINDDDDDKNKNDSRQSLLCDPNYCQHHQPSGNWVHQLRDPNRRSRRLSNNSKTNNNNNKRKGQGDSQPRLLIPVGRRIVATNGMMQQCQLVQVDKKNDEHDHDNDHDRNSDDDDHKNNTCHVDLQAGLHPSMTATAGETTTPRNNGSGGCGSGHSPASLLPPLLQQAEQPPQPKNFRETDVLKGRGMTIHNHIGNRRFRLALHRIRNVYLAVQTKSDKVEVARQLVNTLLSKQVRFLQRDHPARRCKRGEGEGQWEEMEEQVTIAWILRRLRRKCAVCGAGHGEACWDAPTTMTTTTAAAVAVATERGGENETSRPPVENETLPPPLTMDTRRTITTTPNNVIATLPIKRKRVSFGNTHEHQPAPATTRTKSARNDRMITTTPKPKKHQRRVTPSSLLSSSVVSTKKKMIKTSQSSSNSESALRCQATHPNGSPCLAYVTHYDDGTASKFCTRHVEWVEASPRKLRSSPFQYSWLGTVEGNQNGTWMTYQEPLHCESANGPNDKFGGGNVKNGVSEDLETWCATEILSYPVQRTAYQYAHFFKSLGFHSVESILTGLHGDDLDVLQGFKDLNLYHRHRLRKVLDEYHAQNRTLP